MNERSTAGADKSDVGFAGREQKQEPILSQNARPVSEIEEKTATSGSNNSICVLTSGGTDSSVLVAEVARQYDCVWPVFIRSGLLWEEVELFWLRRFLQSLRLPHIQPLQVLDVPLADLYGEHWSTGASAVPDREAPLDSVYLPGRNIILLAKAAIFCSLRGIQEIAIGTLQANPFPDASADFFHRLGAVLSQGLACPIRIHAPYLSLTKADVIRQGSRYPLELTFSCISPQRNNHCGACSKCAERHQAFVEAGVPDPTVYEREFSSP